MIPARVRQVSLETIQDAAQAIYAVARRTPLVRLDLSGEPEASRGLEVWLKLENLQPTGSFKVRGAYNAVRQLTAAELAGGVWTVSAGNAAQGVALAARARGVPCRVLCIETAPLMKLHAIERLGASVVKASYDECWRTIERHQTDRLPGTFVHPFDDDRFISGNGTIGLEIVNDLSDVDAVVASVGGGGLLAGIGAAVRARRPQARVLAAEPDTAAPLAYSRRAGAPSVFPGWQPSFVDGAGAKSVLPTMWPMLQAVVSDSIVVSLAETARAMRLVAERAHVIAEGAAACAVAAALSGRAGSGRVVAVVSGGNVDLATFAELTCRAGAAAAGPA